MPEGGMASIARLVKSCDAALREALQKGRSGVMRRPDGELYVKSEISLGGKYADEVIQIFGDEADLDFFYNLYLDDSTE